MPVFFTVLIRYKRFNGNQGIARIASIASVVFHHGKLFSSDRDDSGDRDDYLETSLKPSRVECSRAYTTQVNGGGGGGEFNSLDDNNRSERLASLCLTFLHDVGA